MRLGTAAVALALAFGTASAGMAQAETFNLTVDGCSGGCLTSAVTSAGTVTVTDVGGALDFSVALQDALFNANGNQQHHALVFDIDKSGLSISGLPSDFAALNSSPYSEAPFGGQWTYAIDYTGDAKQGSTPNTLSFTLSGAPSLSLADLVPGFTYGGQPVYAAADVYSLTTGLTGNVGGVLTSAVPEPATWAMTILGMGLIGFGARRRNAGLALAA